MDPSRWNHLDSLRLADPHFFKGGEVDILLGGEIFWDVILGEKRIGPQNSPMAVDSTLGWLVVGTVSSSSASEVKVHHVQSMEGCKWVERFWELEALPLVERLTEEERSCEESFSRTHIRHANGRYEVELPFKKGPVSIGSSRGTAIRRLKSLEKRLDVVPQIKNQYHKFLKDYLEMGHMRKAEEKMRLCYIPHHFVLKDPLTMTKFRRQILVHSRHRPYQWIVWREDKNAPVEDYELNTVTYGTASAPFLATRVLRELANDEKDSFPVAAEIVKGDVYMDDVMSGKQCDASAIEAARQLNEMTHRGGFLLTKWASNSKALTESIPVERRATQSVFPISSHKTEVVGTLGMNWNTAKDKFSFRVKFPLSAVILTKRKLLSEVAKIYNPLGWLSPTIVKAKILFHELWKLDLGWDEIIPKIWEQEWRIYQSSLQRLQDLSVPRYIDMEGSSDVQLHGFCDSSERAYAAVAYLRTRKGGKVKTFILAAKSRVAPTKNVLLPRLELCGALLLATLIKNVKDVHHDIKFKEVHAWTDSTVALAWIRSHPSRWKTFVGNRVAKIHEVLPQECWHHVVGTQNSADPASRGVNPEELLMHSLRWDVPKFLTESYTLPSVNSSDPDQGEVTNEEKNQKHLIFHSMTHETILEKFSSLTKLQRVIAMCFRFIDKSRRPQNIEHEDAFTTKEFDRALIALIRMAQREVFGKDLERLKTKTRLRRKSQILSLNPFIGADGVIRINGRLRHADITQDRKNSILLPRHHHLTILIIRHHHLMNHHAGSQLLQSIINGQYWIINARDAIRHQIRKCILAFAIVQQQ